MDPPPPRNPNTAVASDEPTHPSNSDDVSTSTSTSTPLTSMKPPPPKFLSKPDSNSSQSEPVISQSGAEQPAESANAQLSSSSSSVSKSKDDNEDKKKDQRPSASVPYTIPTWSGRPCHQFYLEVLKDGSIIDKFDVYVSANFNAIDISFFISSFFCYAQSNELKKQKLILSYS